VRPLAAAVSVLRAPTTAESRVRVRPGPGPQPTTAELSRRATGPAGLAARDRNLKRRVSDGSAPGRAAGDRGRRPSALTAAVTAGSRDRDRPGPGGPPVPPAAVLHAPTTAVARPAPPDWPTENASVASVTAAQYRAARCAPAEIARARHGRFKFENLANLDSRLRKSYNYSTVLYRNLESHLRTQFYVNVGLSVMPEQT
jgi:hypothetical protein